MEAIWALTLVIASTIWLQKSAYILENKLTETTIILTAFLSGLCDSVVPTHATITELTEYVPAAKRKHDT